MNVSHVIVALDVGGAERMLQKIVMGSGGTSMRHSVVTLAHAGEIGAELRSAGVRVDSLGAGRGLSALRAVVPLRRALLDQRPEVVQAWMPLSNLVAGLAARSAGLLPVLWNLRAARLEAGSERWATIQLDQRLGLVARALCDAIVTNSVEARQVHEEFGYPGDLFEVIPNGFDIDRFQPDAAARASVRAELEVPMEAPLVGVIGRFHAAKDHQTFLRAAGIVARERPDVHFVAVGSEVTPDNRELMAWASAEGVGGRFHPLGPRGDLPRLYGALDVCALTSRYESFPNVVGEAMAAGVPCVASDTGDVRDIVGETGVVVPVRDAAAHAAGWLALLSMEPAARAGMGAAARARVAARYSVPAVVARYENLYRRLLDKKH